MSVPGRAQIQGLWIGGNGLPQNVSEATPFQPGQLGKVTWLAQGTGDEAVGYQYIYRTTADSATANQSSLAYWSDVDNFQVSAEATDAVGGVTAPLFAGMFLGASPASGSYGWIKITGTVDGVKCTGTASKGEVLGAVGAQIFKGAVGASIAPAAIALENFQTATGTTFSVQITPYFRNGW